VEKASDALWQLLLGILDKATLTLGDNRRVDLSRCLIFLTSNLGAGEMNGLVEAGLGFGQRGADGDARLDERTVRAALEAARRKFSPEFLNRIDKVVVFQRLRPEHLERILEIELGMVQQRILEAASERQFVFRCTPPVKRFLIDRGTDPRYGARHLKRVIERDLVFPLSNLLATGQVRLGDFIRVELDARGALSFVKEAEGVRIPVLERFGEEWPPSAAAGRAARGAAAGAGSTGSRK